MTPREPESLDDLLQADLDGIASDEERAALRDALSRGEAARDAERRMRSVFDVLARVRPVDPPADLVPEVMRSVFGPPGRQVVPWSPRRASTTVTPRILIHYAYAAAAGAAVCFVAMRALSGPSHRFPTPSGGDAAATIVAAQGAIARVPIPGDGSTAGAALRVEGDRLALDVDLASPVGAGLYARYDGQSLSFVGIEDSGGGLERLEAGDGVVRWTQAGGKRVTVRFAARGGGAWRVDVGVVRGGADGPPIALRVAEGR